MRRRLVAAALAGSMLLALGGTVAADPSDNPSGADCLGVERGERNRDGGDREHGGFGPGQAAFVQEFQPYGQWLQRWTADNCA